MFPLNVMSDVNEEYFAFALTASKIPAQFLASAGRFALSATPIDQAPVAFALAVNHNIPSIEFSDLPDATRKALWEKPFGSSGAVLIVRSYSTTS